MGEMLNIIGLRNGVKGIKRSGLSWRRYASPRETPKDFFFQISIGIMRTTGRKSVKRTEVFTEDGSNFARITMINGST